MSFFKNVLKKGFEASKKDKYISEVVKKSSMDYETAKADMERARKESDISYKEYVKGEYYNLTPEKQLKEHQKIVEREERFKVEREQCITLSMEKKGWTRAQATAYLDDVRKRTNVPYKFYRRYYFFDIPEDEQLKLAKEIKAAQKVRADRHGDEKDKYVEEICDITGWSAETVLKKMRFANRNSGATYKDYYAFKFWEIEPEEQKKYFTQRKSNLISAKYDTDELHKDILYNKELTCEVFSEYFRRNWCISRKVNEAEFLERFKEDKKIVYKPLDGNGGHGIEIMDVSAESFRKIQNLPRGIIESFVVQHSKMSELAPNSVNTLRIVTISDDSADVIEPSIAYAALRIGSGESCVDNFTSGGLVAGIDLATGTIVTDGVTVKGIPHKVHPDTGIQFKGFVVPHFQEALELVKAAGTKIGGYLGWDIAIREDGPVLIEVNIFPGNRIFQMPYACEKIGMMHVMEKYI